MKVEIYVPLYKEETDNQKRLLMTALLSIKRQYIKDYELEVVCGYESITPQTSIRLCESLGFKLEECPRDYLTPGSPAGKYAYRYAKSKADFFSTCQNDDFFFPLKTYLQQKTIGDAAISICGHSLFINGLPTDYDCIHTDKEGIGGSIPSCWMINKHIVPDLESDWTGRFNWDNVLLYKLMTYGPLKVMKDPLVVYNLHEDCTSKKYQIEKESYACKLDAFKKYQPLWKGIV
jgi:hypothetical protein